MLVNFKKTRKIDLELHTESPNCVRDARPCYQEHALQTAFQKNNV